MTNNEQGGTSVLTALFAHNTWANLKLLDFCEGLTDEQLNSEAIGGFGSIRATLIHIIGAEISYVKRVNGKLPAQPLVRGHFPGFDVLKEAVRWTGDELLALARSAETTPLVHEQVPPHRAEYPLASLMVQGISHSIEHRTQIATIITQMGMEPPDMSGWNYMEEKGEYREFEAGV
jgi:uncharacterized damage-inducible protein DinB